MEAVFRPLLKYKYACANCQVLGFFWEARKGPQPACRRAFLAMPGSLRRFGRQGLLKTAKRPGALHPRGFRDHGARPRSFPAHSKDKVVKKLCVPRHGGRVNALRDQTGQGGPAKILKGLERQGLRRVACSFWNVFGDVVGGLGQGAGGPSFLIREDFPGFGAQQKVLLDIISFNYMLFMVKYIKRYV
jgi:hypothetical protein